MVPTVEQRHRAFADAYLACDYNATRAYRYVYGDALSDNTCAVGGSLLLRNPKVIEYVAEAKAAQQVRLHIRQDEPVKAYLNALKADPRKLFHPITGRLLPITELDDETANAIASVEISSQGFMETVTKVKFNSKLAAADALANILGLTKGDAPTAATTNIVARQVIIVGGREIEF